MDQTRFARVLDVDVRWKFIVHIQACVQRVHVRDTFRLAHYGTHLRYSPANAEGSARTRVQGALGRQWQISPSRRLFGQLGDRFFLLTEAEAYPVFFSLSHARTYTTSDPEPRLWRIKIRSGARVKWITAEDSPRFFGQEKIDIAEPGSKDRAGRIEICQRYARQQHPVTSLSKRWLRFNPSFVQPRDEYRETWPRM